MATKKKAEYVGPDYAGMSRQLRSDFYAREKTAGRQEARVRLAVLGRRVGVHKKRKKEAEQ